VPTSAATNRINVLAAFGIAGVVVCTFGSLAHLVRIAWRRGPQPVATIATAFVLLLVAGAYARHDRSEVDLWNQATDAQKQILGSVGAAYAPGAPPPGTKVFLTDNEEYIADGAEVFYNSWVSPPPCAWSFATRALVVPPTARRPATSAGATA
jgi:hypothetical protein